MIRVIFFLVCSVPLLRSILASSVSPSSSLPGSVPFIRHQFSSRSIGILEAIEDYSISNANSNLGPSNASPHSSSSSSGRRWRHHWNDYHAMSLQDEANYLPLVDDHPNVHAKLYEFVDHNDTTKTNLGSGRFLSEGSTWVEPFPSSISLSFRVFGQEHRYPRLKLHRELFTANAALVIDEKYSYKHMRATYSSEQAKVSKIDEHIDDEWIVVTLQLDGRFTAALSKNGTIIQVERTAALFNHIDQSHHFRLRDAATNPHGMLAYILTNITNYSNSTCALKDAFIQSVRVNSSLPEHGMDNSSTVNGAGRRLLEIKRWTGCSPGDVQDYKRYFYLGIAMDVAYYITAGNTPAAASNAISTVLALVNNVYYKQLNIFFQVGDTSIRTRLDNDGWNNYYDRVNPLSISEIYLNFRNWRKRHRNNNGIWHLFTDASDEPGLGCVACTCMNTGVSTSRHDRSSLIRPQWRTMAHELGHNFGAFHPWRTDELKGDKNKIGYYGGLMDYGDQKILKKWNDQFASENEYAFSSTQNSNDRTNKEEMCDHITASITGKKYDLSKSFDIASMDRSKRLPTYKCWSTWNSFGIYWKYNWELMITCNKINELAQLYMRFGPPLSMVSQPATTQLFEWVNGELLRSLDVAGDELCLSVSPFENDQIVERDDTPLIISARCSLTDTLQKWVRNGDQIMWKGREKCIQIRGVPTVQAAYGLSLVLAPCNAKSATQKFIFHEESSAPPAISTNTFYPLFSIHWKPDRMNIIAFDIDHDQVVLTSQSSVTKLSSYGTQSHLFQWINGVQLGNAMDMKTNEAPIFCMAAHDKMVQLDKCDSTKSNQKWVKDGDLIRLKGKKNCMEISDEDPVMTVLKVVDCDASNINQQFIVRSPPLFMIYYPDSKDNTVVTAAADGSLAELVNIAAGGHFLMTTKPLKYDGFISRQLFQWYNGNMLRLTGYNECLEMVNTYVQLKGCTAGESKQEFSVDEGKLRVFDKCVAVADDILTVESCSDQSPVFILPSPPSFTMELKGDQSGRVLTLANFNAFTFDFKGDAGLPTANQLFQWTSSGKIRLQSNFMDNTVCLRIDLDEGHKVAGEYPIIPEPCSFMTDAQKFVMNYKLNRICAQQTKWGPSSTTSTRCLSTITVGGVLRLIVVVPKDSDQNFIYREY